MAFDILSVFVCLQKINNNFLSVKPTFQLEYFTLFQRSKVFLTFGWLVDKSVLCVGLATISNSWTPTSAGLFARPKNALGRILIPAPSSKFGQKSSCLPPLCQSSSDGECFHYGVRLPSLLSRLKVLKQFTKLKIWSKRETIRRRFGSF